MPAYMISQIEVTDPVRYEDYKALSPAAIAAHGGRFLIRGGTPELLEGTHDGRRIVVVEFPTMADARAFYDGEHYAKARAARANAAEFSAILIEGAIT